MSPGVPIVLQRCCPSRAVQYPLTGVSGSSLRSLQQFLNFFIWPLEEGLLQLNFSQGGSRRLVLSQVVCTVPAGVSQVPQVP